LGKNYDSTFLTDISNNDLEREIKGYGDTVIVRGTPTVTINHYVLGQKLNYEHVTSTSSTLSIDKGRYWGFILEDVLEAQSDIKWLNKITAAAGLDLKVEVETDFLADIYSDVYTYNKGITAGKKSQSFNLGTTAAAVQITKTNVLDYITDCETVLEEANVPHDGTWWMIVPSWFKNLIMKSDLKDVAIGGAESDNRQLLNGRMGKIGDFTLYSSNLVHYHDDTWNSYFALFGNRDAITFAAQLSKTRTQMSHEDFGDEVSGLYVYGYEMLMTENAGILYCRK
jgi:hypothetical protein